MDAAVHAERLTLPALRAAGFSPSAARTAAFSCLAVDLFASDMIGHYVPLLGRLGHRLPIARRVELLHFGSLFDTAAVAAEFGRLERCASQALAAGEPEWRLAVLGATLHAVTDFYSHSNWHRLDWRAWGCQPPTWDDLTSEQRAALDLHTAAGHGVRPPPGRCGHAEMNADHAGRPGHAVALAAARRATGQWLVKARAWCGREAWRAMQWHRGQADAAYRAVALLATAVGHWDGPSPLRPDLAGLGLLHLAAAWRSAPVRQWTERRLGLVLTDACPQTTPGARHEA